MPLVRRKHVAEDLLVAGEERFVVQTARPLPAVSQLSFRPAQDRERLAEHGLSLTSHLEADGARR